MKPYGKLHWKVESVTCFVKQGKMVMKTETDEAQAELEKEGKKGILHISFKEISTI